MSVCLLVFYDERPELVLSITVSVNCSVLGDDRQVIYNTTRNREKNVH